MLTLELHAFMLYNACIEDIGEDPVDPASGKWFTS